MVDALNAHDALFLIAVLIVAHPFAVGTLLGKLVRRNEALESDLRVGWNRQASELAVNDLNGFAAHAPGPIQLALAIDRALDARSQKQQRTEPTTVTSGQGCPRCIYFSLMMPPWCGGAARMPIPFLSNT